MRPSSAQVELVEGCTRLCAFCGLNGIRTGPGDYRRMKLHTAELAAAQLRDLNAMARVEFAMHGEPLVHPEAHRIISVFRAYLPKTQIQVTTNGATLMKHTEERVRRLFQAGADFLIVDTYEPEREQLQAALWSLRFTFEVVDFYKDCVPNGWSPWANHRRSVRNRVVIMDDIGIRDGEVASRVVLNHAGSNPNAPIPDEPLQKTCTNPFREITVAYNGNVNICCMDWKHEYVCGNVHKRTLSDIWHGEEFRAARRHLQAKDRRFAPCGVCNKNSGTRSGLLPKMPLPTDADVAVLQRVTGQGAGPAYRRALRVLRTA